MTGLRFSGNRVPQKEQIVGDVMNETVCPVSAGMPGSSGAQVLSALFRIIATCGELLRQCGDFEQQLANR